MVPEVLGVCLFDTRDAWKVCRKVVGMLDAQGSRVGAGGPPEIPAPVCCGI